MNDSVSLRGYVLTLPESPKVALDVVDCHLDDAVDELFRLDLWVHTEASDLSPRDFVGAPLRLDVRSFTGAMKLNGVIASMTQEWAEPTGVSRYHLRVRPWLWLTTQRHNSRIFQDQSAIELIHAIVADQGGRVPTCVERLGNAHPKRDYVSQYGESDWQMIRRKAADAGVSLRANHDGSGSVALCDDLSAFAERAPAPVPFLPAAGTALRADEPHVLAATFETRLAPSATFVRDYDYERPLAPIEARALDADALPSELALERFDFHVGAARPAERCAALATLRLEEQQSQRARAIFHTSVPVAAGTVFALSGHPRADANIEWLVVRSKTRAGDSEARHRVEAVPAHLPERPRRLPLPRVIGTQTAVVVGPEGEEIDVDALGRVCLRFRWDRRAKHHDTTRRVRVSQGWAGPGYGLSCVPRVGDEVIVEFLDGDPDQPIVIGRVHNGINPTPLTLPEQKACSTWRSRSTPGGEGFNEITLDDAAGAERIYVHAQRDANIDVENDVNVHVKGHVNGLVRGNGTGGVRGDGTLSIDGDASLTVGGELTVEAANITATAAANIVLSAGAQRHDESQLHVVRTGAFLVNARGVAQFNTGSFVVSAADITLVAGGSKIHLADGGIEIESAGPVIVNGSVIKLN
jgi:type VI secretion system secreted protein VgrG